MLSSVFIYSVLSSMVLCCNIYVLYFVSLSLTDNFIMIFVIYIWFILHFILLVIFIEFCCLSICVFILVINHVFCFFARSIFK